MHVLLTGFEPFGGESINPSWEAVKMVKHIPEGMRVTRLLLPVSFALGPQRLKEAVLEHQPDAVISVGQAGGRNGISLERIAVNMKDARIADNDGAMPRDEILYPGEENALFSSLPLRKTEAALERESLPAQISNSAGLYVCNAVFYEAARLTRDGILSAAGFIHVPFLPEQAKNGEPSLPLSEMVRALEIALDCLSP